MREHLAASEKLAAAHEQQERIARLASVEIIARVEAEFERLRDDLRPGLFFSDGAHARAQEIIDAARTRLMGGGA